jgi:hypothetical protein
MRFQLHPDDHERYGDGSWVYDEAAILRLPARELINLEAAVGPITTVLSRFREDYTDAKLAVVWIARRQAGIVEDFDTFEPLISLVTVSMPEVDADPPDLGSASSPNTEPPPESSPNGSPGSPSKRTSRRTTSKS